MSYDPLKFILHALIQASQTQPPPASHKMVSLLETVWDRLHCYQKIDLLGAPEVISLLSMQPRTAKDLIVQVNHWMTTTKAACEHDGFSFEWDPEGFTWSFPIARIQRPLNEDEQSYPEYGIDNLYGSSVDFYSLLVDADRHRLYEFRLRGSGADQELTQIMHSSEREAMTQERMSLEEIYSSIAPKMR